MKPLPRSMQAAFPCQESQVPARPWWRRSSYDYTRQDGRMLWGARFITDGEGRELPHSEAPLSWACVYVWAWSVSGVPFKDVEAALAAYDALHPLPHPGLRAGQVWAWIDGDCIRQRVLWGLNLHAGSPMEPAHEALPDSAFLMADPACPQVAPWAPSWAPQATP